MRKIRSILHYFWPIKMTIPGTNVHIKPGDIVEVGTLQDFVLCRVTKVVIEAHQGGPCYTDIWTKRKWR